MSHGIGVERENKITERVLELFKLIGLDIDPNNYDGDDNDSLLDMLDDAISAAEDTKDVE